MPSRRDRRRSPPARTRRSLERLERLGESAREGHPHRRGVRRREVACAGRRRQLSAKARLRDRTGNLRFTRAVLCQLSLGGRELFLKGQCSTNELGGRVPNIDGMDATFRFLEPDEGDAAERGDRGRLRRRPTTSAGSTTRRRSSARLAAGTYVSCVAEISRRRAALPRGDEPRPRSATRSGTPGRR